MSDLEERRSVFQWSLRRGSVDSRLEALGEGEDLLAKKLEAGEGLNAEEAQAIGESILMAALQLDSTKTKEWEAALFKAMRRTLRKTELSFAEVFASVLSSAAQTAVSDMRRHFIILAALEVIDAEIPAEKDDDTEEEENEPKPYVPSSTVKTCVQLVGTQVQLLPAGSKAQRSSTLAVSDMLLRKHSQLHSLLLELWLLPATRCNVLGSGCFLTLALVTGACTENSTVSCCKPALTALVAEYITTVIGHKSPAKIPPALLKALAPFVRRLNTSHWGSVDGSGLQGALLRLLKKAPESGSLITRLLCAQVGPSILLDEFSATGGSAACLRMLKSDSADTRANGKAALITLLLKLKEKTAIDELVRGCVDLIVKRTTSSPAQRAEVAAVLAAGGHLCLGKEDTGAAVCVLTAPTIVPFLLGATGGIAKETDELTKVVLARAVGPWLAGYTSQEAKDLATKLILPALQGKHALSHLVALSSAATRPSVAFSSLVLPLLPVFEGYFKKPTPANRNECMLALFVLQRAADSTVESDDAAAARTLYNSESLRKVLAQPSSFLTHIASFGNDGSTGLEAAVSEARSCCIGNLPATPGAAATLAALCLHPSSTVRRLVYSACAKLQNASDEASAQLAMELRALVVPTHPGQSANANINRIAAAGSAIAAQLPSRLESSAPAQACAAAELLLLAGRLCNASQGVTADATKVGLATRLAKTIVLALADMALEVEELCAQNLCAAAALGATDTDACYAASTSLRALGCSELWQGTLEASARQLLLLLPAPSAAIAAVKAEEARLVLDPVGAARDATAAAAAAAGKGAAVTVTNADRKKSAPRKDRRGLFGADVDGDDDFAERVKAEKMTAQAEGAAAAEQDALEAIQSKIATEGAAVAALRAQTRGLISAFSALIRGSLSISDVACEIAADLLPLLQPLLASTLVGTEAMELVKLLAASSLEHPLSRVADDCCYALLAVAQTERAVVCVGMKVQLKVEAYQAERMLQLMDRSGPFVRVFRVAAAAAASSSVSSAGFAFLFPLLEALLDLPSAIPECNNAFPIFSDCLPRGPNPYVGARHGRVLELCLRAVHRPRMDPKPEVVLLRLCGTQLEDTTPLHGEYGLLCEHAEVRGTTLRVLKAWLAALANVVPLRLPSAERKRELALCLMIAQCDEVAAIAETGVAVWSNWLALSGGDGGLAAGSWQAPLIAMMRSGAAVKRERVARAFAVGCQLHPCDAAAAQAAMVKLYEDSPAPAAAAASGRTNQRNDDGKTIRRAAAEGLRALGAAGALANNDAAMAVLKFATTVGAIDQNEDVRDCMVKAGVAVLDCYAKDVPALLKFLQAEMRPAKAGEDLDSFDYRHEAVVVLLGAAGKYAPADAPELVESIVKSLVGALRTPSEAVQTAVAGCIVPLVQRSKTAESTQVLLRQLLQDVLEAETYGERRGAAFGLAAFIKGMGIAVLKQNDVVAHLRENCEKGSVGARQGALGAFERLSAQLGLLFEPYVVTIIPVLLKSFSHSHDLVREAAQNTAKVIMGRLSAHGVKQVLAPILSSLPNEPAWKTRLESLRLLGTMAHCAPKQLASCLPQIVPVIVDASNDTHPRVKEGAKIVMSDITTVIRNPEVSALSPILLGALADPASKTKAALEALLNCEFMHAIDAPSLALLVPILGRALRDRTADLKRRSAAITGNMVTMVGDSKFLLPYLEQLMPGLKDCLLDPIPDVRATSAKAMGSLVGGVGEVAELLDIIPWLTLTLTTESSPVERSGAAQGLAELCFALGEARLASVLEQALPMQNSQSYAAREGLLWLLSFLPSAMHNQFAPHIVTTLPVILEGLSDPVESVREVALRAGQVMVSTLGRSHTKQLLPALRKGILDPDWRIRHASVSLVGELLYLVGDAKPVAAGTQQADDDEEEEESSNKSISKVYANISAHLGGQITENILATLYIVRHDVAGACRQSSVQVWKSVVTNTPRVIMEVAGEMVLQLVHQLSSECDDLRVMAGRALGDIVSKLGDRILPTVMPHMSEGLRSSEQAMRQGVCLGLAEILNAISKRQIEDYVEVLVPALQLGFCDSSESVRTQASNAFQTLFKAMGMAAIEAVVPALMMRVRVSPVDEEEEQDSAAAMVGLRGLVAARPRDMMEFIIPSALQSPMSSQKCHVLMGMAAEGGSAMQYHCTLLVVSFVRELIALDAAVLAGDGEAVETLESVRECAKACMSAMTREAVNTLLQELAKQVDHEESVPNRRWGCYLLQCFVGGSDANFRDYLPLILKGLLSRIAETDKPLLEAVRDALSSLVKNVPAEPLLVHLDFVRSCMASTASDAKFRSGGSVLLNEAGELELPLFALPKALEPFMSLYNHGLVNGHAERREACAEAMGDLFRMTSAASMKPYLIKTTGPLIRVVGDRFPSSVKSAILTTLGVLLRKGGASLKAFAPQLQTTFVKALNDPSRQTRQRAAAGLGLLTGVSARTDGLLGELGNAVTLAESGAIRTSIYEALSQSLVKAATAPSAAALQKCHAAVIGAMLTEEEGPPRAAGCVSIGALAALMEEEDVVQLIEDLVAQSNSTDAATTAGALGGAAAAAAFAAPKGSAARPSLFKALNSALTSSNPIIKPAACTAVATLWGPRRGAAPDSQLNSEALKSYASTLATTADDTKNDDNIRIKAVKALKAAVKAVNFTPGSDANVAPLPAAAVSRFMASFVKNSKELDPQLSYSGNRGLHYLYNWPKCSNAMTDTLKGVTDANVTNILKEFQRKKVYPVDDADSDAEVE